MVDKPQYTVPTKVMLRSGAQVPVVHTVSGVELKGLEPRSDTSIKEETVYEDPSTSTCPGEGLPTKCETEVGEVQTEKNEQDEKAREDPLEDQIYVHENGDLCAEDIDKNWSIIPEVASTTDIITLDDIQIPDPGETSKDEADRLRQIIWWKRHLLMGMRRLR